MSPSGGGVSFLAGWVAWAHAPAEVSGALGTPPMFGEVSWGLGTSSQLSLADVTVEWAKNTSPGPCAP